MIKFTVLGQCRSQKNRKIQRKDGWTFKNPDLARYERDFASQVPSDAKKGIGSLTREVESWIVVYYPSMRSDLDVSVVYDLLQKAGVVANDRYIRKKHETALIDKDRPRVEITLAEL